MIRHIALFTFKEPWPADRVEQLTAAIRELPGQVPAVLAVQCGPAVGWQQGCDYAMEVDFNDRQGFDEYKSSEAHRQLIEAHVAPLVASTSRIQLELLP